MPQVRRHTMLSFLDASNIGYKITERLGGAVAVGSILQGLRKPLNDLSCGASVEAIINTIALYLPSRDLFKLNN